MSDANLLEPVPLGDQIKAAARELNLSINYYRRQVESGKMSPAARDGLLRDKRAILNSLQALSEFEQRWHRDEPYPGYCVDDEIETLLRRVGGKPL